MTPSPTLYSKPHRFGVVNGYFTPFMNLRGNGRKFKILQTQILTGLIHFNLWSLPML